MWTVLLDLTPLHLLALPEFHSRSSLNHLPLLLPQTLHLDLLHQTAQYLSLHQQFAVKFSLLLSMKKQDKMEEITTHAHYGGHFLNT